MLVIVDFAGELTESSLKLHRLRSPVNAKCNLRIYTPVNVFGGCSLVTALEVPKGTVMAFCPLPERAQSAGPW